ncbi:medium-chain acyl-CoA ligase ACSF2, mitochondrial-like [Amphiura filiformis]|uniref:medium-chain acyl-CoA ligase ACSF2, mitochondrial-like n=1 Tax=Amphiura filiformis TaxID=82378 RepID=UPI003B21D331
MLGIHLSHPLDPAYVLDSAAVYPTGGIEVKIVNEKGETVPIDTRGEICIRGYAVFKYYWMDEKLTKDAKDENGWWHTRDLGIMDDKGYFRDLIVIKEAINVAPLELEAVLYEHEAEADALVVGVPDERSFEEVCACIKLNKENPVTVNGDDIREYCEGKVSTLLMPKYVLFVDKFPTTDTGKFHRRRMVEEASRLLKLKPVT